MATEERTAMRDVGAASVQELRDALTGQVIVPEDAEYDEARSVWNGMIDRRPAVIARCLSAADVAEAIRFARSEELVIAIRGGAHNVAGNATVDGGLVIDLSPMKGAEVDVEARTVRAQPGLTWGELDQVTMAHGLATTGGLVSTTGVAGFTLGGGLGWLMREHGLTCDNLISAQLVTADGDTVRASESENAELLWGLRGGGGNFGVVVEFELRLYELSEVYGGMLAWPAAAAGEVLRYWREWAKTAPDAVCTMAAFLYAPPLPFVPEEVQGTPIVAIACVHTNRDGSAEEDVRGLREQGPALDILGPMPYAAVQTMFDAGAPYGCRNYWRSGYLDDVSDAAIDELVRQAEDLPSPMGQLHIHQLGGAMSRVPSGVTAFGNRDAGFLANYLGISMDPADDETLVSWVRRATGAMELHGTGARYVNFLADEGESGVRSAYEAETLERLRELKRRYDPTNAFRLNQNIAP
jgi:FAD/FMN-containing dehydrogenase